jgi:hypothetical protein
MASVLETQETKSGDLSQYVSREVSQADIVKWREGTVGPEAGEPEFGDRPIWIVNHSKHQLSDL